MESNDKLVLGFWEILEILWWKKTTIAIFVAAGGTFSVAVAFLMPESYRAEALIVPRHEAAASGHLSALAAQFGGVAELGDLGGTSTSRVVAIATLKSRALIQKYIEENQLMPRLYEDQWDAIAKAWKTDKPPTIWQAYNRFTKKILTISEDKRTRLVTVSVEWENPGEAEQWVAGLIKKANEYLRAAAIEDAERNLAYLEAQGRKTSQVELQKVLYGLIEGELKTLMLARGSEAFALRTIDKAVVPMRPSSPNRTKIIIVGLILSCLLATSFVIGRQLLRRSDHPRLTAF